MLRALWLVVSLVFLLIHLIPGDPVEQMLGERAQPAEIAELRAQLGLDQPLNQSTLTLDDIVAAIEYLVRLHAGLPTMEGPRGEVVVETDDIDHFGNRRLRTVGELIQNQIRTGLSRMERVVRERMTTQDVEAITPSSLVAGDTLDIRVAIAVNDAATVTAVSASISTPVGAVIFAEAVISIRSFEGGMVKFTSQCVIGSGWHSGMSSPVFFAARIPARRAVASTLPLAMRS